MTKYKVYISIDGKEYSWVTIENGKVSTNPTKYDMKEAKHMYYSRTNICPRCREEDNITYRSILYPKNALHERDKKGEMTHEYVCRSHGLRHYERYNPNSTNNLKKSLANCRTGNQDPNHESTKGDRDIDLACKLYMYENLNMKYDNYEYPIDCIDPETGLYYQIRGRSLGSISICTTVNGEKRHHEGWNLSGLAREWCKEYEDMICLCKSKDGKIIERIYRFPSFVINGKTSIKIHKRYLRRGHSYEQYRVKDQEELRKSNDILKKITGQ